MFDLRLNSDDLDKETGSRCSGVLESHSFRETFTSGLGFWTTNDYVISWKKSAEFLFNSNFSVFLTDVSDPRHQGYYSGYKTFLLRDTVHILEQVFFAKHYNLSRLINLQFKRESLELIDEDGEELSIWKCPVDDVVAYYNRLRSKIGGL